MAFEALSDRLQAIFKKVRGQSQLSETNMEEIFAEVKIALLEADVNVKVVREFVERLKTKIIGMKVISTLTPSQMVVKEVNEELQILLGKQVSELKFNSNRSTIIMMCGLQGSGKTTTCSKLAYHLTKKLNKRPLLVACDIYRPGAVEQLIQLGNKIEVEVYHQENANPVEIAKNAVNYAHINGYDVVILDTAGRLHIDDQLMDELIDIESEVSPHETILVVDAMSGQDAVNVADTFYHKIKISGVIMTKMDGDARGGAALSIRHMTGVPLKFIAVGEKPNDLEIFDPKRMAERILGMGDVLTLIEKAQENLDEKKMQKMMNRIMAGKFDLEDMLTQMEQANKMGPIGSIMRLLPGMPKLNETQKVELDKKTKLARAVISSMTMKERREPNLMKVPSRKLRVAKGAGVDITDVNKVLKQYETASQQIKQLGSMLKSGRMPKMPGGF